jgi:MOB kinase activator 1
LKRNKQKQFVEGSKKCELHKYAKTTLGITDLATAVICPEDDLLNDWLAVHVQDFYNQTIMTFALIEQECAKDNLEMTAGERYKYLWQDPQSSEYTKPTKVSAAQYCDLLFAWTERHLEDPEIFSKTGAYGSKFMPAVKQIFKRLFRVYAHLYYHHFEYVCSIGADAHVNTCFKHFILFAKHYSLIPDKELAPLDDLIRNLLNNREVSDDGDEDS